MIAAAADRLAAAGCDSPWLDVQLLLARVLGVSRTEAVMHGDRRLEPGDAAAFEALLARRVAREPLAYIVGSKGFRHVDLFVDSRVLIPRPDTETLVEVAAAEAPEGGRVHDVGTGSGAVALALAHERPDLRVSASDASPDAVDVARGNAAALGLDVPVDVARGLPRGDYDLVVANLPYVRDDEWEALQPEIREYEPRMALTSGADGLDAIRALIGQAPAGLTLALEHAPRQARAVREALRGGRTVADLSGRERVTIGKAP